MARDDERACQPYLAWLRADPATPGYASLSISTDDLAVCGRRLASAQTHRTNQLRDCPVPTPARKALKARPCSFCPPSREEEGGMNAALNMSCDPAALDHCREVTRRQARNFYYGLRLLPEPQRSALYCIYAWMRQADDLADDEPGRSNPEAAAHSLEAFREDTRRSIAGTLDSDQLMWQAFQATVGHFKLDTAPFEAMIDGQIADLNFQQPETMDALCAYCRQVASSVGQVCISIWGYDDPVALQLADERGIAFQLTNILRDIREDHENGRIYLPVSLLESCQLKMETLLDWASPSQCEALVRRLAQHGEGYYRSSSALESKITKSCRPTLRAMTRIYHGLLRRIDRNPRSVVGARRVRLGGLRKMSIAITARVQAGVS